LAVGHIEKLLLLFSHFETRNGLRDGRLGEVLEHILCRLTPESMERLANKHDLAPLEGESWRKIRIGGSDDHGGLFPASAFTSTKNVESSEEFLNEIRAGQCSIDGRGGTPLALSHSLYNTVFHFIRAKFAKNVHGTTDLVEKMFSRFLEGKDPTAFTITEKLGFLAEGIVSGRIFELANPANAGVWHELGEYFNKEELNLRLKKLTIGIEEPERRAFLMANHVSNELAFRFFNKFLAQLADGNFFESIQKFKKISQVLLWTP
jgi:hypothetical protein